MSKRLSPHPLALLQRTLEMKRMELAVEIFPGLHYDVSDRLLADCERGKNSLNNDPAALWRIATTFGARPERATSPSWLELKALSLGNYTPLWFFAWTFAGLEPAPTGYSPVRDLALARRIDRASRLYHAYIQLGDPTGLDFSLFEFADDSDDAASVAYRGYLDVLPKDKLFDDRDRLARAMFGPISDEVGLPPPYWDNWQFELQQLSCKFELRPLFHALDAIEKPRRRRISK